MKKTKLGTWRYAELGDLAGAVVAIDERATEWCALVLTSCAQGYGDLFGISRNGWTSYTNDDGSWS